jgi:serine/threonine protein kinase
MSQTFPMPLGRYELVERLAVGGMAELFKARVLGAHGFQKHLVIKKILPHLAADPSFVGMFIDEAKLTARLDHPKIGQVLELCTSDNQLYIVMEFIDGLDVLALLRACAHRKQHLPAAIAVHIAHEVLDALDYAHQAGDEGGKLLGIVHRDISPSNVLISRRGDVKLVDFGIAHAVERQQKTQTGMLKGKYGYMSPEQIIGGELDGRSDLFSVGILLSEMLMGRRLFTAPNELDVLLMVRDVKLDRLEHYGAHIEPDLKSILHGALKKDVKDRYPKASVFRETLAEWLFVKRQRIAPADVAALVESLNVHGAPASKSTSAPKSAVSLPPPSAGSSSPKAPAPDIQALRQAHAELVGRQATAVVEAAAPPVDAGRPNLSSGGPATPAVPGAAAAKPPPPPKHKPPVKPLEPRPSSSLEIPIFTDGGAPTPLVVSAAPAPPVAATKEIAELDFSDLTSIPGLDVPKETPASKSAPSVDDAAAPDEEGDLKKTPAVRILYKLAVEKATGLLVVEITDITKEIYFISGVPEFVSSNIARELLGEYLVSQKIISEGELAMALAMMPHFGGKLGDTLVGLGLMKPLDVFRHLTRQVRDKIVDVCTWQKGAYRWYRGRRSTRESFPLGLDAFEVLGAGATTLAVDAVEGWAQHHVLKSPVAAKNPRVVPEAFRLGSYPRDVYNRLDGRRTLRDFLGRFTSNNDRIAFLRVLYLLVHTDLVGWH